MVTAGGDRRDLMSEWPEGWFRGEQNAGDAGAAGPSQADLSSNKTAGIPAHPGGQYQVPGWAGQDAASGSASGRAQRSAWPDQDRKSTRLNSSHVEISYAVFCLKKKKKNQLKSSEHRNKTLHATKYL